MAAGNLYLRFVRYGSAVVAVGVALAVRGALAHSVGELPPYVTFYPAVMFTAMLAGSGPGVLATGVAALVALWWIIPPSGLFRIDATADAVGLALFCVLGVFISLVAGALRRSGVESESAVRLEGHRLRMLALTFGALTAITLGSTFVVYWMGLRVTYANAALSRSHQVIGTLEATLSTLKDAETGQRGFVLTGDEAYLEPYEAAREHIGADLDQLERWADTRDVSPAETEIVARLARAKLAELEQVVQTRRAEGLEPALTVVRTDVGKRVMDELRQHIAVMEKEENNELDYWHQRRDQATTLRTMVVIGTAIIDLAFLMWAFRRIVSGTAAIQRQRELLGVTLASIGDAVIITDADGRVSFLNKVAEALTGWSNAQAVSRPLDAVFRIVNERTREPVESPVDKVRRLGTVVGLANHTILIAKDGREIPIDDSGAPIRQGDGPVHGVVLIFRDFTERRAAEEALRESEARLASLGAATFEGIALTDDGVIVDCNEQLARMLGYSVPGDLRGRTVEELVVPEDRQKVLENIRVGRPSVTEHFMMRRDGSRIVVEAHGRPSELAGGPRCTAIRDITERRQREARIARLTTLYGVLSHVNEAIVRIRDEQTLCREVCRIVAHDGAFPLVWIGEVSGKQVVPVAWAGGAASYLEQLRVETEGVLGSGPTGTCVREGRVVVNDDFDSNPRTAAWRDRAVRHGFRASAAFPLRRQERVVGALTLYAPEPDAFDAEQISLLEALSADVSYALDAMQQEKLRTEAERSLRESEQRFRTLADAMPQLAWIANAEGWISWYNVRWYEYTGTTPEQMEGWGWTNVHDPEALPNVLERWKAALASGEPFDMTFPLRGADGVFRPFLTRGMPLKDSQGRVLQWFGTNTDISEQKAAEAALASAKLSAERAKAAAEDASRAKDHFLAVLSHELRTPLTPVMATAAMLENEPGLSADVREALEVIRRNTELEARLIDDLLDVTRIARGKVELNRRPVEVGAIIDRTIEVCRPDIEARGLHFGVDVRCGRELVDVDAARIQQVFWNLLKNAIKFTPQAGCIGIRCWKEDGCAVAEFSDSGIGIPPRALGRIFNAFEQAEQTTTRRFGGLGLGLAISKALVELHGGAILAASQGEGQGSTFTVRLPLAVAPTSQLRPGDGRPRAPRSKPAQTRRLRILLVEDHGDTARIMARLLRGSGHEVHTAGDVAMALAEASQREFDLLISDVGLPDGTGVDLLQELRARGLAFPGIAMTGFGQQEDIRRTQAAGFATHLTKPIDFQQLEVAIAAVSGEATASG